MTTQEIEARIAAIKNVSGDPESAHIREDDLYTDFIYYISMSVHVPEMISAKAKLVLSTKGLSFDRWCA